MRVFAGDCRKETVPGMKSLRIAADVDTLAFDS
jgi:hypothetical protein